MVKIEAVVEEDGTLRACKASGHAGAGKTGTDVVCAAVSVLMRTAFSVLSNREGIIVRGGAPQPGEMWLEADYDLAVDGQKNGKDFLFATGVFLLDGLRSVAQEYPRNCSFSIRRV